MTTTHEDDLKRGFTYEDAKKLYWDNRQMFIEESRQYYHNNREMILARKREKFECPCGGRYTTGSKSQHFKTNKHIRFMEST